MEAIWLSGGHLTISEDTVGCHNSGSVCTSRGHQCCHLFYDAQDKFLHNNDFLSR